MRKKPGVRLLALLFLGNLIFAPFYLGILNQKVALYETATRRYYLTDTAVRTLPQADQEALQRGVPLESFQAALSALEDLCS